MKLIIQNRLELSKCSFILVLAFSLLACNNDEKVGAPGPERLEGSLFGYVEMWDEYNELMPASCDSVKVTAVDSGVNVVTYSAEDGKYQLDSLFTGDYTVTCSKQGFGNSRVDVYFLGGNIPEFYGYSRLLQNSSTTFPVFELEVIDSLIYAVGEMFPAGTPDFPRYGVVFFGSDQEISPVHYDFFSFIWRIAENPFSFYLDYTSEPLPPSGTTLYARAYGIRADFWQDRYYDEDLGLDIFNTNPNGSEIATVTIP
jgi:hypothetical protein